jgi:hypothetical protein
MVMWYGRGKRSGGEKTATLLMVRTTAQQKYWYEEEEDGRRGPPHYVGHRKVLRLGIDWRRSTRRRGRLVAVGPSPIPNQDPNPPQRCASEKIRT